MKITYVILICSATLLCSCSEKKPAAVVAPPEAPKVARAPLADPFQEATELIREERYEEALQKHIWIHDHVLEERPSYAGVRLSFALAQWADLGRKYPKALVALKEIRDKKTARLLAGENNASLFQDVKAINGYLGDTRATVDLFKQIDSLQPAFATTVYGQAEGPLVDLEEFILARKYMGDPEIRFAKAKSNYDRGIDFAAKRASGESSRRAFESIFTDNVVQILLVLDRTGDKVSARNIQTEALAVLDNSKIRGAIAN